MLNRAFQILPILCDANDGIHDIMGCLPGDGSRYQCSPPCSQKNGKETLFLVRLPDQKSLVGSGARIAPQWKSPLISGFVNACQRFRRGSRTAWFRSARWKVAPVWSENTSIDIIDKRLKFIDFLTFQIPDSDACSSFLPSHNGAL